MKFSYSINHFFLILILAVAGCLASSGLYAQICTSGNDSCGGGTLFCGPYTLSKGIYRIPFQTGTKVSITNDHMNHCPRGRIDMSGYGGTPPYKVAAAADGWIRAIVDDNTIKCDCSVTDCDNNYVWIEHENGEWTKYTHMTYLSVTALGHEVDDWVTAGTILGNEGDVGCAGGVHLHFEVAQPIDTNTLLFSSAGGYIDGDFAENLVPVICDIVGNIFLEGSTYTAAACDALCISSFENFSADVDFPESMVQIAEDYISSSNVDITDQGAALMQAESYIEFHPGFRAYSGSSLVAQIAPCNEMAEKLSVEQIITQDDQASTSIKARVYPNPLTNQSVLEITLDHRTTIQWKVTDVMGRMAYTSASLEFNAGIHKFELPWEEFSAGMNFIHISTDVETEVVPVVKYE